MTAKQVKYAGAVVEIDATPSWWQTVEIRHFVGPFIAALLAGQEADVIEEVRASYTSGLWFRVHAIEGETLDDVFRRFAAVFNRVLASFPVCPACEGKGVRTLRDDDPDPLGLRAAVARGRPVKCSDCGGAGIRPVDFELPPG